jgi:hypothetical protein
MGQDVGIGSDRYCGCYRSEVQQGWRKDPLGDSSSSRESVTGLTVRKHAAVICEWVRSVCVNKCINGQTKLDHGIV